jgi:hypothetical protein
VVGGAGGQVAEEGQRFGLAEPASELAVELEREAQAGGSGRVVTGQQLHEAEVVHGGGFEGPRAEIGEHGQALRDACRRGRVISNSSWG